MRAGSSGVLEERDSNALGYVCTREQIGVRITVIGELADVGTAEGLINRTKAGDTGRPGHDPVPG